MENDSRIYSQAKSTGTATAHHWAPPAIPKRRRTGTPAAAGQSSAPSSGGNKRDAKDCANVHDEQSSLDNDANQSSDGTLSVLLSYRMLELLDCPVCFDPLSIPVFQCVNGHVLCSDCCERVNRNCPTCPRRTGRIRCRQIEAMLEAIMVPCSNKSYGCPEELSYSSKNSHESTCAYTPYGCPFRDCTFIGTHAGLFSHMKDAHLKSKSVVSLQFDQVCRFSMGPAVEFFVFREEVEGKLFFLNKLDRMSISCIAGGSGDVERFAYSLVVRGKDSSNRFQSLTTRFEHGEKGVGIGSSTTDFIQVPSYLGDRDGCFQLELCIWSKASSSVDIAGAIVQA